MNKAVEACWAGYKEALKERGFGKVFPRLRKKDIVRMSFHDVLELAYDKFAGKDVVLFDKPFGEISDDEWDRMNELVEKRFEKFARAVGFDELKDDETPPIYGLEEQN